MQVEFEAVCGPKFMSVWDDAGDLLQLSMHLTDCLYQVSFGRYRPLVAMKLRSRPKKVVFGPPIYREVSQISDMRFQITLTSTMWPMFVEFRSATSEIKRRKKKEETLVKYKSGGLTIIGPCKPLNLSLI